MIVPGITVATGIIDLTIATTIESLITTDRTIIAAQYSSSGFDRIRSASSRKVADAELRRLGARGEVAIWSVSDASESR